MSTLSKEGPLLMPPMTKARRPKSADAHVGNTKPMRSSPLAGPALSRSLATPVLTVSSNKPTDPLLTVTTPPICHVLHPKSSQNLDSCDSGSSTPTGTISRRRGLGPITAGSARSQSLYIPSTSSSDSGHALPSLRTPASEWEIDPLQSLTISRTPLRPRPSSGIASFRLPIPIVEEEPDWQVEELDGTDSSSKNTSCNSSTSDFPKSRSASQPQVNSWYTTNTYDVTPRFSRLGLSASTVVMPLSPKEHRRLSRNTSLARTNTTTTTTTTTTGLPTKRFFIPSLSSKPSTPATPTRVPLQPPKPLPAQTSSKRQPLSRTFSNTSSSETSSIGSNSQCETPTPISMSTSSPSLIRSRSSEDSISTWYESLPPTTPHLEHMTLPTESDGEEHKPDKGAVDGEIGGEFRGHRDHDGDHGQFHYSDITITINSASGDETQPDQVLTERLDLHPQPTSQPAPQPTTNSPFQIPTFPKDVKKERGSLRKRLVRIKLQPVHNVDDLEDVSSSFSTLKIKTMTTMRLTTPVTRAAEVGGKVPVGLPEVPVPVVLLPATLSVPVINSEDTLVSTSSISLPISTSMKKRSTFKNVFKKFITRW